MLDSSLEGTEDLNGFDWAGARCGISQSRSRMRVRNVTDTNELHAPLLSIDRSVYLDTASE